MRRKRIARTMLAVIGLSALTSACNLYEDGSYRTDDGTTGCLIPSWGCTGPVVDSVKLGPPPAPEPVPLETDEHVGYSFDACQAAPTYAYVTVEFRPNYETGDGHCYVTGTSTELDRLIEAGWTDLAG